MSTASPRPSRIQSVLETVLYFTGDSEAAMHEFYEDVLGLRRVSKWAYRVDASHLVLLFNSDESTVRQSPLRHGATGSVHVCFVVEPERYDEWKEYLKGRHVHITAELTWNEGIRSFYFDDPAGNLLEIAAGDMWPR